MNAGSYNIDWFMVDYRKAFEGAENSPRTPIKPNSLKHHKLPIFIDS
jgi:hypothetical protein